MKKNKPDILKDARCSICGSFGFAVVRDEIKIDTLCGPCIKVKYQTPKKNEQTKLLL